MKPSLDFLRVGILPAAELPDSQTWNAAKLLVSHCSFFKPNLRFSLARLAYCKVSGSWTWNPVKNLSLSQNFI